MAQENVEILWNRSVSPSVMHMGLSSKTSCIHALPGQFVMLRTDHTKDPLLRRPFSIHQVIRENGRCVGLELLYKVVGPVTERMARMKEKQVMDLVAPLGKGFDLPEKSRNVFIVGGGIGIAPLVYLGSWLLENGLEPENCQVFIGGRSHGDVLCADLFEAMGMVVHRATDDGSLGLKGRVTDLIEKRLEIEVPDMIYACGPHPMLKAVAALSEKKKVSCQLSVETLMACGICACMGCAVEPRENVGGYKHVCKNGPVFGAHELKW
ncbi:MAG: dihydroorotate dehydrogenase electron transfer subunit [Proteobacteria bacterium]|nr:dihydroorotate dehydrogenase electron transfer subunit [Pseudomonadota bacterium]